MTSHEAAQMLNVAMKLAPSLQDLFKHFTHVPTALGVQTPLEIVASDEQNGFISALGVVNALLDDAAMARLYLYHDRSTGDVEFRISQRAGRHSNSSVPDVQ